MGNELKEFVVLLRIMIVILLSSLLASCASQREDYRLDVGKRDFTNGLYKPAFHELLPLAMQGNTHAEYAVGYMYYYGYGVAQDTESGMVWMERAASQGSESSQQALKLINTKPNVPQTISPQTTDSSSNY
jgi:TPR repeat protein